VALTESQLIQIRRQVGSKPDDAALQSIYDRTADVDELVLEVLETRLADLVSAPAQFTVVGEYGQDTGKNIEALRAAVGTLGGAGSRVRIISPLAKPPR
jgi:hypothetical protein